MHESTSGPKWTWWQASKTFPYRFGSKARPGLPKAPEDWWRPKADNWVTRCAASAYPTFERCVAAVLGV